MVQHPLRDLQQQSKVHTCSTNISTEQFKYETRTKAEKNICLLLRKAHLVALVSLVRSPPGGVGEDVGLRMLIGPELLLACLQHHGGLHHVLLALVVIEASPQQAGIEAVFVSGRAATGQMKQ